MHIDIGAWLIGNKMLSVRKSSRVPFMCAIDGVLNKCLAMDEVGAPQPLLLIGTGIQGGFRCIGVLADKPPPARVRIENCTRLIDGTRL